MSIELKALLSYESINIDTALNKKKSPRRGIEPRSPA